jgi:hypothetical protein
MTLVNNDASLDRLTAALSTLLVCIWGLAEIDVKFWGTRAEQVTSDWKKSKQMTLGSVDRLRRSG